MVLFDWARLDKAPKPGDWCGECLPAPPASGKQGPFGYLKAAPQGDAPQVHHEGTDGAHAQRRGTSRPRG